VGLVGFSIALVDGALDARLPHARRGMNGPTLAYAIVTLLGLALVLPLAIILLLDQPEYDAPIRVGWALALVGVITLAWWVLRARGRPEAPTILRVGGTASLLLAGVLGVMTGLPHILSAAGLR
jgi:hypothetical protein